MTDIERLVEANVRAFILTKRNIDDPYILARLVERRARMTAAQQAAALAALNSTIDPAIVQAENNITTIFGARDKAKETIDHLLSDDFRNTIVANVIAAYEGAA